MTGTDVETEQVPVLVVGGSLVGLATAAFLAWSGTDCLLVERHAGTHPHQRATGYYPRTMELLRLIGAELPLRELTGNEAERRIRVRMETLTGAVLERFDLPPAEDIADITPSPAVVTDQSRVERVLRERAEALGARTAFHTELTGFTQDTEGVRASLLDRDTGRVRHVRAGYLVAADGNESQVRAALDVGVSGPGVLSHRLNIYFRARLDLRIDPRELVVCQLENDGLHAFFGYDSEGIGMLIVGYDPAAGESPADFGPDRCVELVRQAVGDPELAVELVDRTPWAMTGNLADRFRVGRVFLVGDAALVVPPVGGYGANTGIHAAHNLAWKLSAVLDGRAAETLLDTYETERRPVARYVLEQALCQLAARSGGPVGDGERADELTVSLGYRYHRGALVPERPRGPIGVHPRTLSGEPGTRSPHLWCATPSGRRPLLDLLGPDFVLLTGEKAGPWAEAAAPYPVAVLCLGDPTLVSTPDRSWTEAFGVGEAGAVLVRPDGFVAWRSRGRPADPVVALRWVLARLSLHPTIRSAA